MSQKDKIGILVVDDYPKFVDEYIIPVFSSENDWTKKALPKLDFEVHCVTSQKAAQDELEHYGQQYHIALIDLRLRRDNTFRPDSDEKGGLNILDYINQKPLPIKVIMFTGDNTPLSVQTAFEAITQQSAFDYLFKAHDSAFQRQLLLAVSRAWKYIQMEQAVIEAHGLLGETEPMRRVKALIAMVAPTNAKVLITGESGTGKELVARAIHQNSPRRNKKFTAVNCAAIPKELIESELFGVIANYPGFHNKQPLRGKFEFANGGTIFLDEIGDMGIDVQAKMLRVLQDEVIQPLGSNEEIKLDVRIIAATNKDLEQEVKFGRFREDLYSRLNVVSINMPALRERREDIPLFVEYFIQKYCREHKKNIFGISDEALKYLMEYDWPRNVRELESKVIENAVISCQKGTIEVNDLPSEITSHRKAHQDVLLLFLKELSNASREEVVQEYRYLGDKFEEYRYLECRFEKGSLALIEFSARGLHHMLEHYAEKKKLSYERKDQRQLISRLVRDKERLKEEGWEIKTRIKEIHGVWIHQLLSPPKSPCESPK